MTTEIISASADAILIAETITSVGEDIVICLVIGLVIMLLGGISK